MKPNDGLTRGQGALKVMAEGGRSRHPLVIGLVAPIGTPLDNVEKYLTEALDSFRYRSDTIRLSGLPEEFGFVVPGSLPRMDDPSYYERRMAACDDLRMYADNGAAVSALAIAKVAVLRELYADSDHPPAFILHSLKHPEEISLLRYTYGDSFYLLAVSCDVQYRRRNIANTSKLSSSEAQTLIERDEADEDLGLGQQVRETFSLADAYIKVDEGKNEDLRGAINRFTDCMFGVEFHTPTPEEEGMRVAFDASLFSAALGRQVGAVLIPKLGTPFVLGTNEVPRPGGGQRWDREAQDHRDFQRGVDPNPDRIRSLVEEFLERLQISGWLNSKYKAMTPRQLLESAFDKDEKGQSVMKGLAVSALIEFTRCLHAEQSAIANAARAGVATKDARIFTTTYPCHECAKIILGAGIAEVSYIEAYPKSLVDILFGALIESESLSSPTTAQGGDTKIPFRAFVGIAPRRYEAAFRAGERKEGSKPVDVERGRAIPVTNSWSEEAVHQREIRVSTAITDIIKSLRGAEVQKTAAGEAPPVTKRRNVSGRDKSEQHASEQAPRGQLPAPLPFNEGAVAGG